MQARRAARARGGRGAGRAAAACGAHDGRDGACRQGRRPGRCGDRPRARLPAPRPPRRGGTPVGAAHGARAGRTWHADSEHARGAAQVMLPYYECLPDVALEGLQHDCDFDCPKVRAPSGPAQPQARSPRPRGAPAARAICDAAVKCDGAGSALRTSAWLGRPAVRCVGAVRAPRRGLPQRRRRSSGRQGTRGAARAHAEGARAQGRLADGRVRCEALRTRAFRARIDGVPLVLLRPDWAACSLFRGSRIYGGSYNELEAYLYFSRRAPRALRRACGRAALRADAGVAACARPRTLRACGSGGVCAPASARVAHRSDMSSELCPPDQASGAGRAWSTCARPAATPTSCTSTSGSCPRCPCSTGARSPPTSWHAPGTACRNASSTHAGTLARSRPRARRDSFHAAGPSRARVVLTIHNMDNTRECRQEEFSSTGAPAHASPAAPRKTPACSAWAGAAGLPGEAFATADKALDERTIGARRAPPTRPARGVAPRAAERGRCARRRPQPRAPEPHEGARPPARAPTPARRAARLTRWQRGLTHTLISALHG